MFDKKKLVINSDICDARTIDESAYENYEQIVINADVLFVTARSKALLAKLPVLCNVDETVELSEGEEINTLNVNGNYELGPNTKVAENTVVCVNGNAKILSGTEENLKNILKIIVNGTLECPKSLEAFMNRATVNGSIQVYPDDCIILDARFVMDKYFPYRAKENARYFAEEKVILGNADLTPLIEKNVLFLTPMAVGEEKQLMKSVSLFEEGTEFVEVPEGCTVVEGGTELSLAVLKQYGFHLFIDGDLTLVDAKVLETLETLVVKGTIFTNKTIADMIEKKAVVFDKIKIEKGRKITNKFSVTLDRAMFHHAPDGIMVTNVASLKITEDVSAAAILEQLEIANCASVTCTEEQKGAVELVSSNVASISCGKEEGGVMSGIKGTIGGVGDLIGMFKGAKMVNADRYVM